MEKTLTFQPCFNPTKAPVSIPFVKQNKAVEKVGKNGGGRESPTCCVRTKNGHSPRGKARLHWAGEPKIFTAIFPSQTQEKICSLWADGESSTQLHGVPYPGIHLGAKEVLAVPQEASPQGPKLHSHHTT